MDDPDKDGIPGTWKNRRRVIFSTLVYCAAMVTYLAIWGEDTSLHQDIASGLILLTASVVGSYVFGAIWDDKRKVGGNETSRSEP
ncbi:MAG: hypothetical protein KJO69_05940 [Gammaproteobacteria bacterium]|nr:hypothetical protein [Gammaproteobacteria bacterium]